MKQNRQDKILELIDTQLISTQEQLLQNLEQSGIYTTQATLSRDIKQLRLIKAPASSGISHYVRPKIFSGQEKLNLDINNVFIDAISSIEAVQNMVVIKTYSGMAGALCELLDKENWNGIAGTIAGENTIFVLLRNEEYAAELVSCIEFAISK